MKREPSFRQFWDNFFSPFWNLPTPKVDQAWQRVLDRLQDAPDNLAVERPVVSRPRIGFRFAVAAVLMLTVAIGVYAYRAQRASSAKGVVPTSTQGSAPSAKAAAETPQVAFITPGSTKPEAGLSRAAILAAQIAAAQNSDAGAARPRFAVASVRPRPKRPALDTLSLEQVAALMANDGFSCLGVDGRWGVGGGSPAQGRCTGDVNLTQLVLYAYSPYSGPPPNVEGAYAGIPRDLEIASFQINAVADNPGRVTKGELRQMVQTLLEDRFKVRVHLETRELDGYIMTIAPSGIKFKETPADQRSDLQDVFNNRRNAAQTNTAACPGLRARLANFSGKCKMETLAMQLALTLGYTPVLDKTGLTSFYDIKLSLNEILTGGPTPERGAGGATPLPRQFSPPLPKAVEEQLGLRLERGKVPVEFVVVDHIEAPTEN